MSFIDGLYTISLNLTNTDRSQYEQLRIKTAKHPYESYEFLLTRLLAYMHSYEDGLEFTQGLFDPKQPAIWKLDILKSPTLWIEVGTPEKKRLYHSSCDENCRCRVYFYQPEQLQEFCHDCMRGAATNWVSKIDFFQIDSSFSAQIPEDGINLRSNWNVTIVDSNVYFDIDNQELTSSIIPVDIWSEYQLSIGNG